MAEATIFVQQNSPMALLRQGGVLVGIAAAVALGVYVVMWSRTPHFTMLYSDLSDRDLTQIVEALKSSQTPYRIEPGSGAVLVEASKADDARLQLAAAGLPKGTSRGFEMLNEEQGFGTSQFMEKARYQHAMEGELSRSIGRIDNVRGARVHLALPTESVFSRIKREPSASVIVDLFGGRGLEPAQVSAITHLVSASVPNLPASRVTLVDSRGNLLTEEKSDEGMVLTSRRFDYSRKLERSYADRIEVILTPFVGPDGVRAEVTADLDFTTSEETRESFNPDLPSVRSERTLEEERVGGGSGGVPGALSNAPPGEATAPEVAVPPAPGAAPGAAPANANANQTKATTPSTKRNQTTRNYELDRTISHTKPSLGTIRRLSVAVVLRLPPPAPVAPVAEGADAAKTQDGSKPPPVPVLAPKVDVERMTQLVKDAIGFDATRGDIVSVTTTAFVEPPMPEPLPAQPLWEQPWLWEVGKQAAGGLFVLVLFFGLLRPAVKSLMAKPVAAAIADDAASSAPLGLAAPGGGVVPALAGPQVTPLTMPSSMHDNLEQVKQIVAQDPRIAAQVVKEWLGD
jgi:flagellar M-ring protein FliF